MASKSSLEAESMGKIRVAIVGYGNIGKAVEQAILQNADMEPAIILTRRQPENIKPKTASLKVDLVSDARNYADVVDVAVLCGGSATDLPEQGPAMAGIFNTVDSYDTHALIADYYMAMDRAATSAGKTAVISTGWDPGLFSFMRVIEESVLPMGSGYTFWGPGISQGHSDAIRRVKGVRDGRQYTIPVDDAIQMVRSGSQPDLTTREKHTRECFVVADEGADVEQIRRDIVNMPYYFADYDTRVTFISQEEMDRHHSRMPHGGFVMRTGRTEDGLSHVMEFRLKLDSNPSFTANILLAYARAAYRLNLEGNTGAKTVFDIAPAYLSPRSRKDLLRDML
ncbi:MAG TPA: diaminopimelate dehydrogenase [Methanotrichaceae archaeon]|nr:diaminopimelate dehydrogenase [Methanotrichaceae archaeon]